MYKWGFKAKYVGINNAITTKMITFEANGDIKDIQAWMRAISLAFVYADENGFDFIGMELEFC